MGGVFAVLPAYEADLYGTKYIGAIHGRSVDFLVIILKTLFWQIFDICGCSNCAWSNSFTQSEENGRD